MCSSDLRGDSFQAVKNLPVGDGGALVTRSEEDFEKAKKLRWLGIDKDTYSRTSSGNIKDTYLWQYNVPYVGYKYHMNDINAAIGIEQLKYLDKHNERRKFIADYYRDNLCGVSGVTLLDYKKDRKSSYHFYPILVEGRVNLIKKLKENDIHPGVHYFRNDYYPMYKRNKLPLTERFTNQELTLPIHLYLTDDELELIVNVVKSGW